MHLIRTKCNTNCLKIMIKYAIIPWALFFAVLAFSMMPGYMSLVVIISFIGGLYDAQRKNKKKMVK